MKKYSAVFLAVLLLTGISCSSAPKKPAEVFAVRNQAANQLDLANQMANRGRYHDALLILEDVRKTVTSVDDPPLIIRTGIVLGNVLFSTGHHEEAFTVWENALQTAGKENEAGLAALARVFIARGRIVLLGLEGESANSQEAQRIRQQMNSELNALKGDSLGEASAWVTMALAEKHLHLYTEAENSVRKALAIHEKEVYLEDAAYDWFLIASIRSVAGKLDEAIDALQRSIGYDRRAENGFGVAASWKALGDVYTKKGSMAEAAEAYNHADNIYRALNLSEYLHSAE